MIETTPPQLDSRTLTSDSLLDTVRVLLRDCKDTEELYTSLLDFCTTSFRPLVARCDFQVAEQRQQLRRSNPRIDKQLADQFQDDFLMTANAEIQQADHAKPQLRRFKNPSGPRLALVAAPLMNLHTGATDGAISMVVSDADDQAVHVLARLDAIVGLMSSVRNSRTAMIQVDRDAGAIQSVADCQSVREFAFGIVNSLCNRVHCEQVGFGLEHRRRIELLAVSGMPKFKSNSPGIAIHRQAMEECLDAGRIIRHQPDQQDELFAIHRKWSVDTGNSCVVSIPLIAGTETSGVISLRRPLDKPFTDQEIEAVDRMVQPYGSAIRLLERATAPLSTQVSRAIGAVIRKNRTPLRLVCWAALVAGLWWFLFESMVYRPMCNSTVVSENLRHYTAPFNGKLQQVHVQPGESVQAGQLLVEFDVRPQRLELESINAELAEANINLREALQAGDASTAALRQARVNVLTAQAGALEERIQRARFVAPENGVVVQADLNKRIGQVFPQGEPVLQFAPASGWLLEIQVPDHVASHISKGQAGHFSASARPTEILDFELNQVDGSALVVNGRNVFIARAPLQTNPGWMLNGMQGFARIETKRQPVWWVASHRVIDWFRTSFWL